MEGKKPIGPLGKIRYWLAALLLAVVVAATLSTWWALRRADQQLRNDLLQQARLVAQLVNLGRVKSLTGTEDDLNKADYRRLKEQLSLAREANSKCRFFYLMGSRTDGKVIIYVDSEAAGSKDYSPPGQVYEEVPEGYRRVFDTRTAAAEGPVTDRWGRWITALVPLVDRTTGELVAVMGMDIDAHTWGWDVISRASLPAGLMVTLFILAGLMVITVHSEVKLRDSESLQRRLLENIDAGVMIVDAERHVVEHMNKKGTEFFDGTADKIPGRPCHNFVCAGQEGRCPANDPGGDVNNAETVFVKADGSQIPMLKSVRRIKIAGKEKFLETFIDISEQKRAEEELRESQSRLADLIEFLPDATLAIDREGNAIAWNRAMEEMTGVMKKDILGKGNYEYALAFYGLRRPMLIDFIFSRHGDAERYYSFINKKGDTLFAETNMPLAHGQKRFLWGKASPLYDIRGNVTGAIESVRDVTDREVAEAAIAEEREKLKTLSDYAPFGMALISREERFVYINKKFTELFGYDLSEVPDVLTWYTMAFPDDGYRQTVLAASTEDLSGAGPGDNKTRILAVACKDGSQKIIRFIVSVLVSRGYMMACEDITEFRKLENQLRQAQKMEAIGTLAGGIAHDFNNILTALNGYATLLQMKMDVLDPLRSYVDEVLAASERAADLTRSLLAFSRQQPTTLVPLSLNNSVKTAEKLLRRLLTEDIDLRIQLCDEDPIAMADKSQIDQIFFNLVTNARDAMSHGGIITIETNLVDLDDTFRHFHGYGESGTYALLSFSDTGLGMDETTRERIFDPFFTTKEVGKGTGLGLSTVYGIVKQHRGYINAYSEPGMGTVFHVYLPVAARAVTADIATPAVIKGGHETILIAEDNESVRTLMKAVLTEHGYSIIEAVDGEDAAHCFAEVKDIGLVILDTVMPKKNGRQVYDEIMRLRPGSKVLFTSGYTRDIILDKGMEEEKFEFIQKPVSPYALLRKVRQILDGIKGTR